MDGRENGTVRALVMDVDGTLTDGGIYIGGSGEAVKRFHVRDGYAIRHMLPACRIIPVIITGRESEIVRIRCAELGIVHLVQGSRDKKADLMRILQKEGISLEETAYIGDDLNDLECMKIAGLSACPADAADKVKEEADYITEHPGGHGAVREFIEWIISRCGIADYDYS